MGHSHTHLPVGATISPPDEAALRRVSAASVAVALSLVVLKGWAWSSTNTVSLLSSLADSLFDALTSAINFFAIRYALKPADAEHRFGHNSIEDMAGLAQFAFICGSMLFVVAQSVQRLLQPEPVQQVEWGIGVMSVSLVATIALVAYQRRVYRQTGSIIVKADSIHYLSDILMNLAIIISLGVVAWLGWLWVDAALAIFIAAYVVKEAWEIGARSFNNLMDREMANEDKQTLRALIQEVQEVRGYHRLRTRYSGMKLFIELHIELDRHLSLEQAHAITERLEQVIKTHYPMADIMIHQDPV